MDEQESTTTNGGGSSTGKIVAFVVIALLLIGGGYYFLLAKNNNATPTQTTTAQPTTAATTAPTDAMKGMQEQTITVEGGNYFFKPNEIRVKKGDKVKITFTNSGGFHDFVIDEYNVKTPIIQSGKTATVEFTAYKAGTFQYYCSVANHRAMGMQGNLVVE